MKAWKMSVCVFVAALSASGAFAADAPAPDGAMAVPKLTDDEVAAIKSMSTPDLANLVRTGNRNQKECAVKTLIGKDQGNLLLSIAKDGPKAMSDVVIETFVPKAMPNDGARALQLVDDYVAFLEDQLKAESPIVSPDRAVRSLARVAYWAPGEHAAAPGKAGPEPRYRYERVVTDLVGLLKDKRVTVSDAASSWLGNVGGYTAEQAKEAGAALEAYRQAVAAQPAVNEKEQKTQEMRLAKIDQAIKDVKVEQERRIKAAATQPDSPSASDVGESGK